MINRITAIRAYEKVLNAKIFDPPKSKDLKPEVEKERSVLDPPDHRGQIIDMLV